MARGGHHGGSTHSGSHHGGSVSRGGSHHSGVSFGSSSRGGYSSNDPVVDAMAAIAFVLLGIMYWFYNTFGSAFNILNVLMMTVGTVLLVIGTKRCKGMDAIQYLKTSPVTNGCPPLYNNVIYKSVIGVTDGASWYNDYDFCLIFSNYYTRKATLELAHEEIKKWPFFLKISDFFWYIGSIICFIVNLFSYEALIPLAENAIMSDQAFWLIDNLIFYFPAFIILINGIAFFIISKVRIDFARKVCIKVVDTNISNNNINSLKEEINNTHMKYWYYNECPNCATDALSHDTRCKYCGSSLKIADPSTVKEYMRHQVCIEEKKS